MEWHIMVFDRITEGLDAFRFFLNRAGLRGYVQFNKYTHTYTREWHRITRMTGPDCAVMCNLINTHTQRNTHTHIDTLTDTNTDIINQKLEIESKKNSKLKIIGVIIFDQVAR